MQMTWAAHQTALIVSSIVSPLETSASVLAPQKNIVPLIEISIT
jgi:hypothetical protein